MQVPEPTNALRRELRRALCEQTERGLLNSAKWVGEQLVSLPAGTEKMHTEEKHQQDENTLRTLDLLLFAKSLFDLKEYLRCADVLQALRIDKKSMCCKIFRKAFFLRLYSLYLAGEKRKEEETLEMLGKK